MAIFIAAMLVLMCVAVIAYQLFTRGARKRRVGARLRSGTALIGGEPDSLARSDEDIAPLLQNQYDVLQLTWPCKCNMNKKNENNFLFR